MNNRIQIFDFLKGIAVLLMIQVHIVELFATQSFFESSTGKFLLFLGGPPVAPVFLIAFGFFLAKRKTNNSHLFKRALFILFIGLMLNILLNLNLILKVLMGLISLDIKPYIFGVDILINAALSLLIILFLKSIFKENTIPYIIIIIISAFLGNFLISFNVENQYVMYFLSFFYGAATWSYFPLFPWLSYTLTGYVIYLITKNIKQTNYEINNNVKILLFAFFILFLFFTLRFVISIASDVQHNLTYYHHGFIFYIWVIIFLLFYTFFLNLLVTYLKNTYTVKYLKWLGKNVTLIYVVQWIIIGNIATEIFKTVNSIYILFFSFIAITVTSTFIVYLLLKIRGRNKGVQAT